MRRIEQRMGLKLFMILLILAMLASNVSAIGIARGFGTVGFEPNKKVTLNYYVYNDEHKDGVATLSIEGSLADKADIQPKRIEFTSNQELMPFTVTFKLPEKKEGDLRVVVQEIPQQGGQLTATVRAVHNIQFSEREKKEETPETTFTPIKPEEQEIRLLAVKRQPFISTTTGKSLLLVAILATIINALIYLYHYLKGKGVHLKFPEFKKEPVKYDLPKEEYPELTHFIKKGHEHGLHENLIVSKLTDVGWKEEVVREHLKKAKR